MTDFRKYRKRQDTLVVAVRLDLETEGFAYQKWGGTQTCKPGDWLLKNGQDTYTVDGSTFEATYEEVSPGIFRKVAAIWAKVATKAGTIETQEGTTDYATGDFIVYNEGDEADRWAIQAKDFEEMYEEDPG